MGTLRRMARAGAAVAVVAVPLVVFGGAAGADTSLVGYNASIAGHRGAVHLQRPLALVPLPNENSDRRGRALRPHQHR